MSPLRPRIRRLFRLDAGKRVDAVRDVDEEMQLHIALRTSQLIREGYDAESAALEARRLFAAGDASVGTLYAVASERNHELRRHDRAESWRQDAGYALRRLRRDALVTAFLVLTLAFGIGANVTAFSLVDRVLLRGPEHVREPGRLARFYIRTDQPPNGVQTFAWMPYGTYGGLRRAMNGVSGMGAYRVDDEMVGSRVSARKLRVGTADGHFFPLLGVTPLRGRLFAAEDDAATSGALAVISESFWRTEFNADPGVIGRTVVVKDLPRTIVGVTPSGFNGPGLGRVDLWLLFDSRESRNRNWNIVARLAPGTSIAGISAASEVAHRRTLDEGPRWTRDATILATPIGYDEHAHESMESVMARWLAAVSAIILLITCANVVNLQLARLARRRQEMGVRVALGAGRGRIVRLIALESAAVGLLSGAASIVVARIVEPIVRLSLFHDAGWTFSLFDWHVITAVAAVTLVTTLIIGIVPAIQVGRASLTAALRSGTNRVAGGRSGLRQALTVAQAALSVLLLVGAGLFLRSLGRMRSVDLGMNPDRIITAEARYPVIGATKAEQIAYLVSPAYDEFERQHYARLREAVSRVPGVERAALTIGLPFYGSVGVGLWLPGRDSIPSVPGGGPHITAVGDGYFETMGTRLIRGRTFTEHDGPGTEPVVIVAQTMATVLWPAGNALGSCLVIFDRNAPCARVVGVVADIHRTGYKEEPSLQYYVPIGQERGFSGISVVIRTAQHSTPAGAALRKAIIDADPGVTAVDLRPLGTALDDQARPVRLGAITFTLSGALALLVAALGLYSLMSYMVAWRTHEIGVRMAIGATERQAAGLVVREGVGLTVIGIVLGLTLALVARHWLQPQLFETSAADPLVFAGVGVAMLIVALAAGWIPARRAARISPTEALRVYG